MNIKAVLIMIGCALSLSAMAGTIGGVLVEEFHPWLASASLGYTDYQNMYHGAGQTALGRFAIGRTLFFNDSTTFGMEIGVQNGGTMRIGISKATLDELGGLPIQSTVRPMLDLLATVKTTTLGTSPFFVDLKGGIAYRRWQFEDRSSIKDLSQIAGEVQAGLGFPLSHSTTLSLLYQGIYGGNPNFRLTTECPSGHVSTIPIQHGLLLSLSLTV